MMQHEMIVSGRTKEQRKTCHHPVSLIAFMPERPLKDVDFTRLKDETQLGNIIALISNDLSEPYSIYVYRYFIQQWYTNSLKLQ